MANDTIPTGHQSPFDNWGEFNRLRFIADQAIRKIQTSLPVRVDAVTNAGGLTPVGFVDITPLVNQIDGAGNPVPHVTIYNVPYFRIQGGANGIIIDPEVGDIGMAAFCSRDITKVKKTKARANPGSLRYHNFADGMYFGGFLNGTPTQYVQFSAAGIAIHSPVAVNITAPVANVTATTSATLSAPTASLIATIAAALTAPAVTMGADGVAAKKLVTEALVALFNAHTHPTPAGESSAPSQTMGDGQLTANAKAN